jgi:Zn-dependent peptidase ImmA (M78 family)
MTSSIEIGDALEKRIYDFVSIEIEADRFLVKKEYCKIFRKKGYYSRDRETNILFDISVEIFLPDANEYSIVVLIECKNYTHSVPVDDVEEFFVKVQQVAASNGKAVVASSASFQSGARAFAKSKGMGLIRYFDGDSFKWELRRSPCATGRSTSAEKAFVVEEGLARHDFLSSAFEMYFQSPSRATNFLWEFFEDFLFDSEFSPTQVECIVNARAPMASQVPFLEKSYLEERAAAIVQSLGYSGGEVSLDRLCAKEASNTGLLVKAGIFDPTASKRAAALGRITFEPPVIEIFAQEVSNYGRERFTLAHELSHYLLGHGQYLLGEFCDDGDFTLSRAAISQGDVSRMEFQANYLAASILMPWIYVQDDFRRIMGQLDLADRGFGPLFLDVQQCNILNCEIVIGNLMRTFGVSFSAAKIRLQSMGLLHDSTDGSESQSVRQILLR